MGRRCTRRFPKPRQTVDDFVKPALAGRLGRPHLTLDPDEQFGRHLLLDRGPIGGQPSLRSCYEAVAHSFRDLLTPRWIECEQRWRERNAKRVCYVSMEFLIGRMLANNICNLQADPAWASLCARHGLDPLAILEQEPEAGLGNGGLGRLAACMLDSMATLGLPATGYGLRYQDGIFRQALRDGAQSEQPDPWLALPDPWEVARPEDAVEVRLGCSYRLADGQLQRIPGLPSVLRAIPHDRPVVGYGGQTIGTLRLWSATSPSAFDFDRFSAGDFVGALLDPLTAKTLTLVLYPDDRTPRGRELRLLQEFFLVACTLADVVRRLRSGGHAWSALPDLAAIQLNDTHPAMAVPELMRILLDEARLGWPEAWELTRATLAYTNHTLLPEALERWPVGWLRDLLPRQLEIILEINSRLLATVRRCHPGDEARVQRMSLVEEGPDPQVRMAHLAVAGCHKVNGVSRIHSQLLRDELLADFAALYPKAFTSITNGVTQRRFLLLANPDLAGLVSAAIGTGWIRNLATIAGLRDLADDAAFQQQFLAARQAAKLRFCAWLRREGGPAIDPQMIFDSQIKRVHEYKRQLLNALHIVILYNRLRHNAAPTLAPRVFFFAGKAAPGYAAAKLLIRFINDLARTLEAEPACRDRLRVVFLPDYSLSVAEHLIPASDVSEQLSTAGFEASGTSNMKFMLNGALTIGTRDGATIEMADAVGAGNIFLFGLSAGEIRASRSWYNPRWHYDHEPETRAALDLVASGHFSPQEPGRYGPLVDSLLRHGDYYMHLADLSSYADTHARLDGTLADRSAWARMAILNVAASGPFSSDRAVSEYATRIWSASACPP